MKVAVTGGREVEITEAMGRAFCSLLDELEVEEFHHGDARGVDRGAAQAVSYWDCSIKIVAHLADWELHGKAAGLIRNKEMLGYVEALIAFPGGRGTEHCIRTARQMGLPVYEIGRS